MKLLPIRALLALIALIALFAVLESTVAVGQIADTSIPAAIATDPPADATHPAAMAVIHIPSHGVQINGLVYQPAGAGPHPTLVICHGMPGNEKNLDVAQAVRRAGWNAVTFNYRGSWGSPGSFRFRHNLQDAEAVLAYLRAPANASKLGIDTHRIVIYGHSMGGWVALHTAAHDHALSGLILVSAADMGLDGQLPTSSFRPSPPAAAARGSPRCTSRPITAGRIIASRLRA
jgi:pimeloyl-ACP methyl ester carboxylesterase